MQNEVNDCDLTVEFRPDQILRFVYKNWEGVVSIRTARFISLIYGANKWHTEPQWLIKGFDEDRKDIRFFAVRDMLPEQAK